MVVKGQNAVTETATPRRIQAPHLSHVWDYAYHHLWRWHLEADRRRRRPRYHLAHLDAYQAWLWAWAKEQASRRRENTAKSEDQDVGLVRAGIHHGSIGQHAA